MSPSRRNNPLQAETGRAERTIHFRKAEAQYLSAEDWTRRANQRSATLTAARHAQPVLVLNADIVSQGSAGTLPL